MNAFDELANNFSRLPGIGKKSANRMVNWLLKQDAAYVQKFAQNLGSLQESPVRFAEPGQNLIPVQSVQTLCAIQVRSVWLSSLRMFLLSRPTVNTRGSTMFLADY